MWRRHRTAAVTVGRPSRGAVAPGQNDAGQQDDGPLHGASPTRTRSKPKPTVESTHRLIPPTRRPPDSLAARGAGRRSRRACPSAWTVQGRRDPAEADRRELRHERGRAGAGSRTQGRGPAVTRRTRHRAGGRARSRGRTRQGPGTATARRRGAAAPGRVRPCRTRPPRPRPGRQCSRCSHAAVSPATSMRVRIAVPSAATRSGASHPKPGRRRSRTRRHRASSTSGRPPRGFVEIECEVAITPDP